MLQHITFHCCTISPMFLSGADKEEVELRPPSLKGALRFWWRALNGHLPIEDRMTRNKEGKPVVEQAGLRTCEMAIFGGEGQRSSFSIHIKTLSSNKEKKPLVPHKGMYQSAFVEGSEFEITFTIPKKYSVQVEEKGAKTTIFDTEKLIALFHITCLLGGLGKRARRGMGGVYIRSWQRDNDPPVPNEAVTLEHIYRHISVLTPHYSIEPDRIIISYQGQQAPFGWVRYIHLGKPREGLLLHISQTTHDLRSSRGYDVSLGHAFKGRFASPIYVSVVPGSLRPVITTLNTLPDRNIHQVSLSLQEEFRNRILHASNTHKP